VSEKLQPLIFSTLSSFGFLFNRGKVGKIRVAPIGTGVGNTYPMVIEVEKDVRERKTPTSYFFYFALNWFPTKQR